MDSLPIINVTWVAANHARYVELLQHGETCPICFREYSDRSPALSPLTEGRYRCTHWMCEDCLLRLRKDECPFCKDDITQFIQQHKVKYSGGGVNNAMTRSYVTESALLLSLLLPIMDCAWEGPSWVTDISSLMPFYNRVEGLVGQAVALSNNLPTHPTINGTFPLRTSGYPFESTIDEQDERLERVLAQRAARNL